MKRDALISECGLFRYWLTRVWEDGLPLLSIIMLNPSKADAMHDDHTITKLISFARQWGFGGFIVVNLFAFRATCPKQLKKVLDPVGKDNNTHIIDALLKTDKTLCAWGGNAAGLQRERDVRDLLRLCGIRTYALKVNDDGTPAHPLMLPYSRQLSEWTP